MGSGGSCKATPPPLLTASPNTRLLAAEEEEEFEEVTGSEWVCVCGCEEVERGEVSVGSWLDTEAGRGRPEKYGAISYIVPYSD